MNHGVIVGEVWATRMAPGLTGHKMVLVDLMRHGQCTGEIVVAVDPLDGHEGDHVLVTYGSGARNTLHPGPDNRHLMVDAAIAQITEEDS